MSNKRACGFTLVEVAVATIVIALGVLAVMSAQQAIHQQNDYAQQSSTALMLANELRELTIELPFDDPISGDSYFGIEPDESNADWVAQLQNYDDLDDFAGNGSGLTFDPPINALRRTIQNMDGWSQTIAVENVLPGDISGDAQAAHSTGMLRVTVCAMYQGPRDNSSNEITRLSWVTAGRR